MKRLKVLCPEARRRFGRACLTAVVLLVLVACHETKNLEDTLYVGIADISYNKPSDALRKAQTKLGKWTPDSTSEGFITAEYHAMQSIIDNLSLHAGEEVAEVNEAVRRDSLIRWQKRIAEEQMDVRTELDAVLSYAPNNSLFGSSSTRWPLPLGLWAYNKYVGAKHRFGKWMFNTFAATPRYLSSANPKARVQVATNTLHNFGFFRGEVEYDTIPVSNPRKSKLAYSVYPHELFRLDSIAYVGFTPREDSLIVAHWDGTLLHRDDPFQARNLQAERERLNDLFQNNGYYYHQPSHIVFRADTTRVPERVQLQVMPAREVPEEAKQRYYIGRTTVRALDYGFSQPTDSMQMRDGSLFCWSGQKSPIRYGALRHWLFYLTDPKDLPASMLGRGGQQRLRLSNPRAYNKKLMSTVHEKLLGMGCFSQVNMTFVPRDSSYLCDTLDVEITAVLDKPYNAEFRGDVTSKSNGLVGPGVGFSFTKKNAFRGAESLSFDAYASYEWMTGADVKGNAMSINSYEYGASLNLIYPKLKFFNMLRRLNRYASASTTFDVKADWLNRSGYYSRATFGFGVRYNYQRRRYVKHELTPFNLDYNVQLSSSARFDSLMDANRALSVSMRNQFVPSMQYVMQMTSRASARNKRTFVLTAKEAGNVVSGLYAAFGQSFQHRDKHLFGVPFAQYFKLSAQYTQQFRLGSTNTYLAGRLYGGFVKSFGNSLMAPYNDLFSIGGANSIRAFSVRTIGPGAYKPSQSGYSYIDQVGDLKFEANVELRFPIVSSLYGAAFVDAGNVWLLDPDKEKPGASFNPRTLGRELALGTGLGLRYDLDIMVIRFDVGVGIHAPYDTGRSGYYNMTRFGRSLGYHLAVGYPF